MNTKGFWSTWGRVETLTLTRWDLLFCCLDPQRWFHSWATQVYTVWARAHWSCLCACPYDLFCCIGTTWVSPWKKSYDQPRQHIKKQRHCFANKGPSSQSYGFSVVMYGCKSWSIKKAEHWRIDAFELWCWRRLLRVPWTARRSNQSILKEMNPQYSLKRLKLKLKLQYFGHLMRRADSFVKTLMLGKIEGRRRGNRRWDGWMASPTQWTWVWANSRR